MSTFSNAADLVFSEINDAGEFVYDNVKSGVKVARATKVNGAKGHENLTHDMISRLMQNGGVPAVELEEIPKEGAYAKNYDSAAYKKDKKSPSISEGPAPRSIVNNWSLIKYRGLPFDQDKATRKPDQPQLYMERPKNPTAAVIIEECNKADKSEGYRYTMADFVFCEHYGRIANNHLLTLRRFAFPVEDNIIAPGKVDASGKPVNTNQPAIATACTWMSPTLGNELKNILKFSVGFNWKDATSQLQEINNQPRDRGKLGSFMDSLPFAQSVQGGIKGESASTTWRRRQQGDAWDPLKQTYPNHARTPVNIIDKVVIREKGLNFDQSFQLQFHYNLKGIPGTSPKIAFLDVLANLLIMTYNNAPFWGGAVRYTGGGKVGKPFGDLQKLQKGDYKGFFGSVIKSLSSFATKGFDDIMKGGSSKILNNIGGGAIFKLLGGPQGGEIAAAFLTGDATGQWHLTVGNPLNPMAVIGNLVCEGADFEFDGPVGYEDFPSKLKVTIKLKPARPRDKSDIESMFNVGKGRLYVPEKGVIDPSVDMNVGAYGEKVGDNRVRRLAGKYTTG